MFFHEGTTNLLWTSLMNRLAISAWWFCFALWLLNFGKIKFGFISALDFRLCMCRKQIT
jgi:hypothetical protein